MGIHYQVGNGLSGFLTDGPFPYTTPGISTRWFPVFNIQKCQNYLMIAHRVLAMDEVEDIEFKILLYNSFGSPPIQKKLSVKKYTQTCLKIEDLFPNSLNYLKDRSGWVYMSSTKKQKSVIHYAALYGKDSIGVCHAF